ncbi:hypothetical protein [Gemmobacter lutimaris]|uniref:hypothetical protein n=1 Tax=Gemmobacter lutimaris TaxID=2306023 RepID=UPI0013144428|nr:hypothetical protein [Gemmobacter lutimaris]
MWTFASMALLVLSGLVALSARPVQALLHIAMIVAILAFAVWLVGIVLWLAIAGPR